MNDPQQLYSILQIVDFLALELGVSGADARSARDKIRKQLVYAIEQGHLECTGPPQAKQLSMPQVRRWARDKWPEELNHLNVRRQIEAVASAVLSVHADVHYYPGNLETCHKELRAAYARNEKLAGELAAAQAEITHLRPLAEKYEQNRETNRTSAKKPRTGL